MSDCVLADSVDKHYPRTRTPGGLRYLHRLVYEAAHGPIADGMTIDHTCFNRRCVNPEHLEQVTVEENVRREKVKHGWGDDTRPCARGHPANWRRSGGTRQCRDCHREQQARSRATLLSRPGGKLDVRKGAA